MYLPHRYAYLTTKQDEKEEKSAIYPFHVDYSSLRQKKQQVKLPQIEAESTQPIGSESAASEQGQSQEYSDSFESYYDSFQEEPISEESDPLQQSINPKPQQSSSRLMPQKHLQYILLSQSQLRKSNEKLVTLKQQLRTIASKYKHNLFILHRQRQELSMLRNKKKKALDADYDYSLSWQYDRKKEKSQMMEESIRKVRRVMKRQKVRRLKEEVLFDDPNNASCVMSSSRVLDHRAALLVILLTKREEVLSKRRQSDKYEAYLSALVKKQEQLKQILDIYDGMIAKGNSEGLEKRVQYLRQEIELKKAMVSAKEHKENLKIVTIENEISAIETKIGQFEQSNTEQKLRIPELYAKDTKAKVDMFVRKKISSQLIPKAKLQQNLLPKPTPKSRIKLVFPSESKTPTTHAIQPALFKANNHRLRQHTTHQ